MRNRLFLVLFCLSVLFNRSSAQVLTYVDQTQLQMATTVSTLTAQGYRPVTLTSYGDPTALRFASVWIRQNGPAFQLFLGITATELDNRVVSQAALGRQLTKLTAVGPTEAEARFSGVFEQTAFFSQVKRATTQSAFVNDFNLARQNGLTLLSLDIYGTANAPIWAAVWSTETSRTELSYSSGVVPSTFVLPAGLLVAHGARLALLAASPGGFYTLFWRDESIGPWAYRYGLSAEQFQSEVQTQAAAGLFPISIQAKDTTLGVRFNAVFAQREFGFPRNWRVAGKSVSGFEAMDEVMRSFMRENKIRGGALAVTRNGRLIYARGYTWAEEDYATTQPETTFRIASMSKPITSLVTHQRIAANAYGYNTPIQTLLDVRRRTGAAPADARWANITVGHLLSHLGGFGGSDPMFADQSINSSFRQGLPITQTQIMQFMADRNLSSAPGAAYRYSNFGYMLLGRMIEMTANGQTYQQAVKSSLFAPLGVTRPFIGSSLSSAAGEARYHSSSLWSIPSAFGQGSTPVQYGGWNLANLEAAGSWVMAAPDFAKVLAAFDIGPQALGLTPALLNSMLSEAPGQEGSNRLRGWLREPLPGGTTAIGHAGFLEGTSTAGWRRTDGVSFVVFFNRDNVLYISPHPISSGLNAIADALEQWPTECLFSTVGIPSFNTVAGRVALRDFPGASAVRIVTLEIRNGAGDLVQTARFPVGDYHLVWSQPAGRNYQFTFKSGGFLPQTRRLLVEGAVTLNVELVNGDTDGSGAVDDADLTNLILDFGGQSGVFSGAVTDLDGNGVVDDGDLTVLILNFGETSD